MSSSHNAQWSQKQFLQTTSKTTQKGVKIEERSSFQSLVFPGKFGMVWCRTMDAGSGAMKYRYDTRNDTKRSNQNIYRLSARGAPLFT